MREPGLDEVAAINTFLARAQDQKFRQLLELALKNHPGAQVVPADNGVAFVTIHSTGATDLECLQNAINGYNEMMDNAVHLRSTLDAVHEDLKTRGMSRDRHDSDMTLLDEASTALNDAIIIGYVQSMMVPSYTREIDELRRRVETRLMMVAQEMAENEKAKKRAAQTFTRKGSPMLSELDPDYAKRPGEGIISWRRRTRG